MTPAETEPYAVVHGWPRLPPGYVFGQVTGVDVDSSNDVWIFHRAENSFPKTYPDMPRIASPTVARIDGKTGQVKAMWGENMFIQSHGLRVDSDDNIWLTDHLRHQVFKFTPDGRLLMTIGKEMTPGRGRDTLGGPTDVAFDADGCVYVADGYDNRRVVKFSPDGEYILEWGEEGNGPGQFLLVHGIAIDGEGNIYVADRHASALQVFDPKGKVLAHWRSEELGKPWGLDVGPDNLLYMIDGGDYKVTPDAATKGRSQITKLDLNGNILARWSRFGNQDGQTYWGHSIAVGADGAVYAGDVWYGMRVQKFLAR